MKVVLYIEDMAYYIAKSSKMLASGYGVMSKQFEVIQRRQTERFTILWSMIGRIELESPNARTLIHHFWYLNRGSEPGSGKHAARMSWYLSIEDPYAATKVSSLSETRCRHHEQLQRYLLMARYF
jgi:hypothetical protein